MPDRELKNQALGHTAQNGSWPWLGLSRGLAETSGKAEDRRAEDLAQVKGLILADSGAEGRGERSGGTGSNVIITAVEAVV